MTCGDRQLAVGKVIGQWSSDSAAVAISEALGGGKELVAGQREVRLPSGRSYVVPNALVGCAK